MVWDLLYDDLGFMRIHSLAKVIKKKRNVIDINNLSETTTDENDLSDFSNNVNIMVVLFYVAKLNLYLQCKTSLFNKLLAY